VLAGEQQNGDDDIAVLWRALKKKRCPRARERLILHYAPLVGFVAARLRSNMPPSVEHADLVSDGVIGLIEAMERFDLSHDVKFETYALPRIRGAMIDQLRALDWVPRSVRAKTRELERATGKLHSQLLREPTRSELAAELDIEIGNLRRRVDAAARVSVVALEELLTVSAEDGDFVSLGDTITDDSVDPPGITVEVDETRAEVREAMRALSERELEMIVLYYFEGWTLAGIGKVFGVTESRVSQIHSKALHALRTAELAAVAGVDNVVTGALPSEDREELRIDRRLGRARESRRPVRKSA
jgi:RNA polymerase sigma factor for flagellar operon FliA